MRNFAESPKKGFYNKFFSNLMADLLMVDAEKSRAFTGALILGMWEYRHLDQDAWAKGM